MTQRKETSDKLPKGVTQLPRDRGGRRFRSKIRHKGLEVHLGLHETVGLAAFAFNVAWEAIGRGSRVPNQIPQEAQPDADEVWRISQQVRRRLGLEPKRIETSEAPPDPDALLTFFEITVVGFWRDQGRQADSGPGLDAVARRLSDAARLIFWSEALGHPSPIGAMARLLTRRIDQAFRRSDLSRAILDDDGEEAWRVARWLVLPDDHPMARGFRDEVRFLYPELFEGDAAPSGVPGWAWILGVDPPFSLAKIRDAYRSRSKQVHPDAGGSHADFIRLRSAFEEATDYCQVRDL